MAGDMKRWFAQYPAYNDPWHSVEVVLASDYDAQARELAEAVGRAKDWQLLAEGRDRDLILAGEMHAKAIATLKAQLEAVRALPRYRILVNDVTGFEFVRDDDAGTNVMLDDLDAALAAAPGQG